MGISWHQYWKRFMTNHTLLMWKDLNLYVFILNKATGLKEVCGSECIAPWILDLDTIWKVASLTHRPLCRCYLLERRLDSPKCQSVSLGKENGTPKSRVLNSRCSDYVDCFVTNVTLNLLRMERQYLCYWAGSLFIISIPVLWLWPWIYYLTL